jgi:hypothetical protein
MPQPTYFRKVIAGERFPISTSHKTRLLTKEFENLLKVCRTLAYPLNYMSCKSVILSWPRRLISSTLCSLGLPAREPGAQG